MQSRLYATLIHAAKIGKNRLSSKYFAINLLFPWQNGDGNAFFLSTIFSANVCFLIEKCRFCIGFDGF